MAKLDLEKYKDFLYTDEGTKLIHALPTDLLESFSDMDLARKMHGEAGMETKAKFLMGLAKSSDGRSSFHATDDNMAERL